MSVAFRIEAITLPVSDVDRARDFYVQAGWNLDLDTVLGNGMRVVQLTPPGSVASISFGTGMPQSEPGSYVNTYLVVTDIEAAHADLKARGIEVSDIYHWSEQGQTPGPDPSRGDYGSYADFADPDGNTWLVQEVPSRS
jgi:catechol 2,3-dioxygenase-like lactoylglutathione lyase family enzyme